MSDKKHETFPQGYFDLCEPALYSAVLTCCVIYAMLNWAASTILQHEVWEPQKWFDWILIAASVVLTVVLWSFIIFHKKRPHKNKN